MCLVCIEYAKGKLTVEEAMNNIQEIKVDDEHFDEVMIQLIGDLFPPGTD